MKRSLLSLATLLLAMTTLSGCFTLDGDDGGLSEVYSGITIFDSATTSNNFASDGLSVLMRFAIMQAEMKAEGLEFTLDSDDEPDWDELSSFDWNGYDGVKKRYFLFGSTSNVKLKMIEENSVYTVDYDYDDDYYHVAGLYDSNYRIGTYQIETYGLELEETTETTPWKLTIYDDEEMSFAYYETTEAVAKSKNMTVLLWSDSSQEGRFCFSYGARIAQPDEDATYYSWNLEGDYGTLTLENYTSLLVEDTIDNNYELSLESMGNSIYGDELIYTIKEPLVYNYSTLPSRRYGGTVAVEYVGVVSDSYPALDVEVAYDGLGGYTVYYNGFSYTQTME